MFYPWLVYLEIFSLSWETSLDLSVPAKKMDLSTTCILTILNCVSFHEEKLHQLNLPKPLKNRIILLMWHLSDADLEEKMNLVQDTLVFNLLKKED